MSEIKTRDMRAGKRWQGASEIIEAMQAEIDELRAALKERDAEIVSLHSQWEQSRNETDVAYANLATQCAVMQQALEAAEKFRAKCHDGRARSVETYDDMTQLVTALKEALK